MVKSLLKCSKKKITAKKRLRHELVQDAAIFISLIAKNLMSWSYTSINDTTKTIAENAHITSLVKVSGIYMTNQIKIASS